MTSLRCLLLWDSRTQVHLGPNEGQMSFSMEGWNSMSRNIILLTTRSERDLISSSLRLIYYERSMGRRLAPQTGCTCNLISTRVHSSSFKEKLSSGTQFLDMLPPRTSQTCLKLLFNAFPLTEILRQAVEETYLPQYKLNPMEDEPLWRGRRKHLPPTPTG